MIENSSSNNVWIELIIVLGGVVTTWITLRYKDRISAKMKAKQTPDRIEFIYQGYEGLIKEIKNQLEEALDSNERQHDIILRMRDEVDHLREELKNTKAENLRLLEALRQEKKGV